VTAHDRPLKGAWGIVSLLVLFMLINFADKVVVNIAGPPMREELGITPEQFGLVGSSFFFLFSISAITVGFLTNRLETRHALMVMSIVWALAQFPMLGLASLEVLIACRILLGAGEGPAGPVATHAAYKWFPDQFRGLPTAIIAQGSALGIIVAAPALSWVVVNWSWQWAFGVMGIASIVWCVLWHIWGREGTLVDPPVVNVEGGGDYIPYRYLLTCPSIIGICCAGFASYWGLVLGFTWTTSYLVEGLHYGQQMGGSLTALPFIVGLVVVLAGGALSQRLLRTGHTSRLSRGVFPTITVIVGGCILPCILLMPTPGLKFATLIAGGAIGSTIYVVLPMVVSELTPQPQRSAMLAITTSLVTSAGLFSPWVMGWIVQNAATPVAGYERGYAILGVLMIIGGLIGLIFIRPEADKTRLARRAIVGAPLAAAASSN
jgi:MFS family permease